MLYNVSAVQQSESAICIHTSPLFLDFLPIQDTAEHCIEFPVLYVPLVIYLIHISVVYGTRRAELEMWVSRKLPSSQCIRQKGAAWE